MRTAKINICSYDELSERAKEYALSKWNEHNEYPWKKEVRDVIDAFEEGFNVSICDWNYDAWDYNFHLDTGNIDDNVLALRGNRARSWFWNNHGDVILSPRSHYWTRCDGKWIKAVSANSRKYVSKCFFDRVYDGTCPFTGYYLDCEILDPVAYFCFGTRWDEDLKKRVPVRHTILSDNSNTVGSILEDCCNSFFKAVMEDVRYNQSEEAFSEACKANGYCFTEDGKMFSGSLEVKEKEAS